MKYILAILIICLSGCSAASLTTSYEKKNIRNYVGPDIEKKKVIEVKKGTEKGDRKIKVTRVGNEFIVSIEGE